MHIIRLNPERWSEYKDLRLEALRDVPQAYLDTVEESLLVSEEEWRKKLQSTFFAENDEGYLVGMIGYYTENRAKLSHIMNLASFYVRPAYRGQGIGRMLISQAITYTRAQPDIKKIQLSVTSSQESALALYQSLGFMKIGTQKMAIQVGGVFYDKYLMEMYV